MKIESKKPGRYKMVKGIRVREVNSGYKIPWDMTGQDNGYELAFGNGHGGSLKLNLDSWVRVGYENVITISVMTTRDIVVGPGYFRAATIMLPEREFDEEEVVDSNGVAMIKRTPRPLDLKQAILNLWRVPEIFQD